MRKIVIIDYDAPKPKSDMNTVYIKTGNPTAGNKYSKELRNEALDIAYRMRPDVIEIRIRGC